MRAMAEPEADYDLPSDPTESKRSRIISIVKIVIYNVAFVVYFIFALLKYIENSKAINED